MTRAHVQQASDVQVTPAGPTVVRERLQDGCVGEQTRMSQPDRVALKQSALSAARELFPLEFMNRFDQILVYQPLGRADLRTEDLCDVTKHPVEVTER